MKNKRVFLLLVISTVLTLIYSVFLFFPYFDDVNEVTLVSNHLVFGYQIGFGYIGQSDQNIKGSMIVLISSILGVLAFVFNFIFMIYFKCSKSYKTSLMFLIFALTIPFIAIAVCSIIISWPIYHNLNATKNDIAIYSPYYFVSLIALIGALAINMFLLIYLAINRHKLIKSTN